MGRRAGRGEPARQAAATGRAARLEDRGLGLALTLWRHDRVKAVEPLGERLNILPELGIAARRELRPNSAAAGRVEVAHEIVHDGLELEFIQEAEPHLIMRGLR